MDAMSQVETTRLVLRQWRRADLDPLADIFAHAAVWRYPFGHGLSKEQTKQFLDRQRGHWRAHGFGLWAAELKDSSTLIGYIGLSVPYWLPQILPAVEVGYRLHPRHWGKGIATEGAEASLRHGFTVLGLDRIVSIYQPENPASGRVMQKIGMHPRGREEDPQSGVALEIYEITLEQWKERNR